MGVNGFRSVSLVMLLGAMSRVAIAQEVGRGAAMSLSDVLKGFRGKYSLADFADKLRSRQGHLIVRDSRRFQSAPVITVEGERGMGGSGEQKITAMLKQNVLLGVDINTVINRYTADADSELVARKADLWEQEKGVALLYTKLRLSQELSLVATEAIGTLTPLIGRARRGAEQGSVGGFVARRWQILLARIESDNIEARRSYSADARTLSAAIGSEVPADLTAIALAAVTMDEAPSDFAEERVFGLMANRMRQKALAAEASQVRQYWEVSAGIGLRQDLEAGTQGVVVEVDIPIFSSTVGQSASNYLEAERSLLASDAELVAKRARDQFLSLKVAISKALDSHQLAQDRVEGLARLYGDVEKAFGQGQVDVGEVVETFSELYEARVTRVRLGQELEESIINLKYLLGASS